MKELSKAKIAKFLRLGTMTREYPITIGQYVTLRFIVKGKHLKESVKLQYPYNVDVSIKDNMSHLDAYIKKTMDKIKDIYIKDGYVAQWYITDGAHYDICTNWGNEIKGVKDPHSFSYIQSYYDIKSTQLGNMVRARRRQNKLRKLLFGIKTYNDIICSEVYFKPVQITFYSRRHGKAFENGHELLKHITYLEPQLSSVFVEMGFTGFLDTQGGVFHSSRSGGALHAGTNLQLEPEFYKDPIDMLTSEKIFWGEYHPRKNKVIHHLDI